MPVTCYNLDMAGIVGIHGIAQQFGGGYQLGSVWYPALRDGLKKAGYAPLAAALAATDLEVAFFGDLFLPPGTMAAGGPPLSANDVRPGPETELLTAFYEAAVAQNPALGPPPGALGAGKAAVQVMLNRLAKSATFAKLTERVFVGNLKQVIAFLTDPTVKQNVLGVVRDQVGSDTKVMIGHSLGSVVAYEYLCLDRPRSIELLITLGSPLGIPNVVFDKLTPKPARGAATWPGTAATWVNVADPDDIVALRKDLAPLFKGSVTGQAVTDRLVHNGKKPHAAERYLNSRQTGSALGAVLGS